MAQLLTPEFLTAARASIEKINANCWDTYLAGDPKSRNWTSIFDALMLDARNVAAYATALREELSQCQKERTDLEVAAATSAS